jgi:hypothetical protein
MSYSHATAGTNLTDTIFNKRGLRGVPLILTGKFPDIPQMSETRNTPKRICILFFLNIYTSDKV